MEHTQPIEVVSYNLNWPVLFELEAAKIKETLGDNCLAIHHIGSTAVPGLAAKPVIDMIPVVQDIMLVDKATSTMQALGLEAKDEYGILFRRYFRKENANIHVYEQGSGEIDRCLKFRDWMRTHPADRQAYAQLKNTLAQKFPNDIYGYCSGKDAFVAAIDEKTGVSGIRVVKALTPGEWSFAKKANVNLNSDLIENLDHLHLILYQGSNIVGYTHIELLPAQRQAIFHNVFIEKNYLDSKEPFLTLCKKWLKSQGYNNFKQMA